MNTEQLERMKKLGYQNTRTFEEQTEFNAFAKEFDTNFLENIVKSRKLL